MIVWRICKARYAATAFSGLGAEKSGGRWNHKGERMVYASSSLSLAALELFVHLEPLLMPRDLRAVSAIIPDRATVEELTARDLPKNWRRYPAPAGLRKIGSRWLHEMRSLLLVVPSAVNPEERNILINPLHPEAATIHGIRTKPFRFDPRMWK